MSKKELFCKENERVLRGTYSDHGNQKEFTVNVHIHMGTCIGNSVCEIVPQCSTMLPEFQLHFQWLLPEIGVHVISCYFLVLVWKCLNLTPDLTEEDFDVLGFDSNVEMRKNLHHIL